MTHIGLKQLIVVYQITETNKKAKRLMAQLTKNSMKLPLNDQFP